MKNRLKLLKVILLGTLFAFLDRLAIQLRHGGRAQALPNSLGLMNDNGIESLLIDPASGNLPFASRYLLIKRGATGYQYGDVCNGGVGGPLPLGVCPDAPYAIGDVLAVRRLGNRRGIELGIGVAATAVTVDNLLVSAAGGKVQDVTTLGAANGTYWCVGRAAATVASTDSTMEVPFIPCVPYQVINTGGTLTIPANPV